jgi:hypothetical protein
LRQLIVLLALIVIFTVAGPAFAAPFVDGTVFRDFNYNGVQEAGLNEPGVEGVEVLVFLADGTTPIATATTNPTGTFVVDLASVAPRVTAGDPLRVEFVIPAPLNQYLIPGRHNSGASGGQSTTVRFINAYAAPAAADVNLALVNPADYCHTTNPDLVTSCYIFGPQTNGDPVLIEFPYESGTTSLTGDSAAAAVTYNLLANDSDVGAVWGTAYRKRSDDVYVAAFARQHSGYRPGGNPGDIMQINRTTGAITVLVTLPAGTNNHNTADYLNDDAFWPDVGTVGLGDIDISDDETTLYAVNLFDRRIYTINLLSGATASFPIPLPPSCSPGAVRPGALKFKDGDLYIGLTCSGPTDADLRAYVYRNNNEVASFPLTYARGQTSRDAPPNPNEANWRAWVATETTIPLAFGAVHYPQPWLLDIEFDERNFMIASIADRFGYQAGNDRTLIGALDGVSAGDILRLSPNNTVFPDGQTGWDIENNGSDGTNTTGGAGNAEGPGGGEFYFHERYELQPNGGGTAGLHRETSLAGITTVLGRDEVVTAAFDPAPTGDVRTGGLIYLSNVTGRRTRSAEIFIQDAPGTFGKAAGIGDVEALCGPAPLEIGNYVWLDEDMDGVQDPDDPIANVIVSLYIDHDSDPATPVLPLAQTTTDGSGHYYFNETNIPLSVDFDGSGTAGDAPNERMFFDINSNGVRSANEPAGILPLTAYEVRIDDPANFTAGAALFEYYATAVLAGGNNEILQDGLGNYRRDSNGANVAPATFVSAANFVTTGRFTVGDFGSNDHTFDFGFAPVTVIPPTPTTPPSPTPPATLVPPTSTPGDQGGSNLNNTDDQSASGDSGRVQAAAATPSLLEQVNRLPSTGETPRWRVRIMQVLLLGSGLVVIFIVRYSNRRRV